MARSLEEWFAGNQRPLPWREHYDPYEVWISEVMAQQTRIDVVVSYWRKFLDRFPSIRSLAEATEDDVLAVWSGLGYYRRARMLRAGAIELVDRFDGEIPSDPSTLESIAGIGPYTAGAISSIAFDRPVPIVDGNVRRVFSRMALFESRIGSAALDRECRDFGRALVTASSSPRALNQAVMELGATICSPARPSCGECPVAEHCVARAAGRQSEVPRARAKKKIIEMTVPVYVVTDSKGRFLLLRRDGSSLMEEMFRLPGDDSEIDAPVHLDGLRPVRRLGEVRHSITNRRIRFLVWDATIDALGDRPTHEIRWVRPAELSSVPHPSWVRKAIELRGRDAS